MTYGDHWNCHRKWFSMAFEEALGILRFYRLPVVLLRESVWSGEYLRRAPGVWLSLADPLWRGCHNGDAQHYIPSFRAHSCVYQLYEDLTVLVKSWSSETHPSLGQERTTKRLPFMPATTDLDPFREVGQDFHLGCIPPLNGARPCGPHPGFTGCRHYETIVRCNDPTRSTRWSTPGLRHGGERD